MAGSLHCQRDSWGHSPQFLQTLPGMVLINPSIIETTEGEGAEDKVSSRQKSLSSFLQGSRPLRDVLEFHPGQSSWASAGLVRAAKLWSIAHLMKASFITEFGVVLLQNCPAVAASLLMIQLRGKDCVLWSNLAPPHHASKEAPAGVGSSNEFSHSCTPSASYANGQPETPRRFPCASSGIASSAFFPSMFPVTWHMLSHRAAHSPCLKNMPRWPVQLPSQLGRSRCGRTRLSNCTRNPS